MMSLLFRSSWILFFIFFAHSVEAAAQNPNSFFVSTSGNDAHPGTLNRPFRTPEKARDAIRELKRKELTKDTVTVYFRKGDYFRTKSLDFSSLDGGFLNAPIIWTAYKNEKVRFIGGVVVSDFKSGGDAHLMNKMDLAVRKNIVIANLKSLGINDFGELKSRGFNRPTLTSHGELFFNDQPMTLARWPNVGEWERIKDFPKDSVKAYGQGEKMGSLTNGFFFNSDRPKRWKNTGEIWLYGYWAYDWANSYERVTVLDTGRLFLKTASPHGNYGFVKDQRFCFLNVMEELDQPGEWFLDKQSGILYFWPPTAAEQGEAIFSMLEEPFIRVKDAEYISFSQIEFTACRGNAIEIKGGKEVQMANCLLQNIGNNAIVIDGGFNHGVKGCDIFETGDCGVHLTGGNRETLTSCGHFVENCHFQKQGRWTKCYVPAISMNGVGMRASHNLIHDHPHAAILFVGNEMLIEYNDIHHTALETGDVGAIYTGLNYTYRGNRIRYNYIHETGGVRGSKGIYMDDCVSGTEVFGNIFYKVHWGMFIGGGRDHLVQNNLFVDCHFGVRADGRGVDPKPMWQNMVNNLLRASLNQMPVELYREKYPAIKSLDKFYGKPGDLPIVGKDFKGVPPEGNSIINNACFGPCIEITEFADQKIFNIENNFVTSDKTNLGSPSSGFLIPPNSPVWKMGFKPIPFKEIGLFSPRFKK